jgi:hypothetical protein
MLGHPVQGDQTNSFSQRGGIWVPVSKCLKKYRLILMTICIIKKLLPDKDFHLYYTPLCKDENLYPEIIV